MNGKKFKQGRDSMIDCWTLAWSRTCVCVPMTCAGEGCLDSTFEQTLKAQVPRPRHLRSIQRQFRDPAPFARGLGHFHGPKTRQKRLLTNLRRLRRLTSPLGMSRDAQNARYRLINSGDSKLNMGTGEDHATSFPSPGGDRRGIATCSAWGVAEKHRMTRMWMTPPREHAFACSPQRARARARRVNGPCPCHGACLCPFRMTHRRGRECLAILGWEM
jgi:hypothetical protein